MRASRVGVDHLVAPACAVANRNLTELEWARFIGTAEAYRKTCPSLPLPAT